MLHRSKNLRAEGLPLNTIVVAAIVLIVLIVIIIVFTNKTGKFVQGTNDCEAKGGTPYSDRSECQNGAAIPMGANEDEAQQWCCLPLT